MSAPSAIEKLPRTPKIRPDLPAPSSTAGELFHYTPHEAAEWLPFSGRKLLEMAYRREVVHVNNGNRIWFSGLNIRAITLQFTVAPFKSAA